MYFEMKGLVGPTIGLMYITHYLLFTDCFHYYSTIY